MKKIPLFFFLFLNTMMIGGSGLPEVPDGLPPVPVPEDNPLTLAKAALGEKLFFDPGLSGDGTVSCASCHDPDRFFADTVPFSKGVGGHFGGRNASSVLNSAYLPHLFWDGRSHSLEDQARYPLTHPREMNNTQEKAVEYVAAQQDYIPLFAQAFGDEAVTWERVSRAIASFQRTLLTGNAPFDRYMAGNDSAISEAAKRGFELFRGRAGCIDCHHYSEESPFFTNFDFHNTGVGWWTTADMGRWDASKEQRHKGAFRTPSLRNVAETAPYMHDGEIATLEDVLDFYSRGGVENQYQDERIQPLVLTREEKIDLVAFLESLTGEVTYGARSVTIEAPPDLRTDTTGRDWPRFLGPEANGKSPETAILTDWPVAGPPVRWHIPVGKGYSVPSIFRGRLFLFDRHGDRVHLRCLQSETGVELWRSEYLTDYEGYYEKDGGPIAAPVVDQDRVCTYGVEGRLRCHRVIDGELLWEVDTGDRFGVVRNFFGVGSTPWIEGDLLIAQVGGSPPDGPGFHSGKVQGNGSGIVAFDKYTGAVRYSITDELASYSSPVVATIRGQRRGFAFTRGGLVAFEPLTGEVDFFFPWRDSKFKSVNAATPVVVDDTVFVSESYGLGGALLRIGPESYDLVWKDSPGRTHSLAAHWNTPIYHRGYLYASSGRHSADAELRCVQHATGKVMWSEPGLNRATLLYVDEHLIVLTEYGRLLLIEATPERFKKVAEVDLGAKKRASGDTESADVQMETRPRLRYPVWNSPILSHHLLYARGSDQLICFDLHRRTEETSAEAP